MSDDQWSISEDPLSAMLSPVLLDDLRKIVSDLTSRGVAVEFVKEQLTFTGEYSALSKLLLSVMGAFAEFERSLLKERQRERIALAKAAGIFTCSISSSRSAITSPKFLESLNLGDE